MTSNRAYKSLSRYGRIMARLREHLKAVTDMGLEWVYIAVQGSQNYNLDYEASDIDSKCIVLPSFEDIILNRKPKSTTHEMENKEHVDIKDIRLMFDCFKKQNINFLEILFTSYRIVNPKYMNLFKPMLDNAELIANYNNYAAVNCIVGMALEKQKAMEHPYPSIVDKIERFGYDPKQLHHALRMKEFFWRRYKNSEAFGSCLKISNRDYFLAVKKGELYNLEEARFYMEDAVEFLKKERTAYMESHKPCIDKGIEHLMQQVVVGILKQHFTDSFMEERQ